VASAFPIRRSHGTAASPWRPLGASAGALVAFPLVQGASPILRRLVSRLKKGVVALVKKCFPDTSRLVGPSLLLLIRLFRLSALAVGSTSNCRASLGITWSRFGYVDATHEALKRVATAPLAVGTAVELLRSQV